MDPSERSDVTTTPPVGLDTHTSASASTPYTPLRDEFAHVTQKMYTQNLALAQTNRTLSMLRSIDSLILDSSRDLPHMTDEISQILVETVPFPVAGILSLNRYNEDIITLQGFAYNQLLTPATLSIATPVMKNLYLSLKGRWLSSDEHYLIIDTTHPDLRMQLLQHDFDESFVRALKSFQIERGVQAVYFTKVFARNTLNGVLMVGLDQPMPTIDNMELIERMSETIGIALDNRLLYEGNQHFLQELQTTNSHLRDLDQAKDEFIALVSHQLRTPLTSIKGFLSLVLEGEAGLLPDKQRTMLQQAFDSSQRMVYLITDLLNVSRLRSGKFIIMNHDTFLPDLIETEVNQLQSTATSRNLKLTFQKPEQFPVLLLDDMKIRQVVMNFLDNALYYTPAGGRVTVELLVDDKTVKFMVTDTGLGVPQAERSKLFTQFYRAGNAKKKRPEGTGLGLYMAKKVILAQGGATIFESVEGKGSTFGFMLPLEKVLAPAAP
jgi:signal transduction histidine kinase